MCGEGERIAAQRWRQDPLPAGKGRVNAQAEGRTLGKAGVRSGQPNYRRVAAPNGHIERAAVHERCGLAPVQVGRAVWSPHLGESNLDGARLTCGIERPDGSRTRL